MWLTVITIYIQVFTAEGKFLRMFGRCGEGRGELKGPIGVAIDSSGRVYISEVDQSPCVCVHLRGSVCDIIWQCGGGIRTVKISLWTSCG